MKQTIRWGILGTGQIAHQFAQGLLCLEDTELLAIGARSKDKADAFSQQYNVERSFGSFNELLADKDIDVVYIATPHHVHHEHCLLALNAGKAVLCEKPFTINEKQALEVVQVAREKNLFCMEAMWMRFIPAMHRLTELLEEGAIGKPALLRADFGVPFKFTPSGRIFDLELAGGAMLDLGIYPVSLACSLFGPPVETIAIGNIGESGVDESSTVVLRHAENQISTLRCSIRHELTPEAVVVGSLGSIEVEAPIYRPHKLKVTQFSQVEPVVDSNPGPSTIKKIIQKTPGLQNLALRAENFLTPATKAMRTSVIPFKGNGYNYEAAAVNECLREGKTECDLMSLDDTLAVLRVMDQVREQWKLRYAGE